jgi:hypothetical protein
VADKKLEPNDDPQFRTAVKDPEHLKRFLSQSGRKFLVFNALDLVDALRFPDEVQVIQQVVERYRKHRATKKSAYVREGFDPPLPEPMGEFLEPDETMEAIRQLHDAEQTLAKKRADAGAVRRTK